MGSMRHRITVQRPAWDVVDEVSRRIWESVVTSLPVSVVTTSGTKLEQGEIREGETQYQFSSHFIDGLDNKMRLLWNGKRLYVKHVSDEHNHRRSLKILANQPDFETVTISRDGQSTEIPAIRHENSFVDVDAGGQTTVTGTSIDWLIDTADLILSGLPITPNTGDIIAADGDVEFSAQPFNGELWQYSDPHRTFIRVHTMEVPR